MSKTCARSQRERHHRTTVRRRRRAEELRAERECAVAVACRSPTLDLAALMYITARPASAPDPLTYGTTYGTLQEPLQVVLVVRRVALGSPERSGARLKLHKFVGLPRRHEPRREAVVDLL